ncbi:hypothetical protein OS493_000376 [Desmophyllum pertusum]|uniref:Uncharacterized protein n=1 Tax=Desmophyllum pertusum TaxID=174260 RepID=A0A9X0DC59_9CNID|nr:hypothetical protein OS493_000376 [Desmophyllum pertusum]
MSRAFSEALTTSANGQPINLSSILELAPEQLLSVKGQVVSISSINIVQTYYGGKQDLMIRDKRPYCMCQGSAVGQYVIPHKRSEFDPWPRRNKNKQDKDVLREYAWRA